MLTLLLISSSTAFIFALMSQVLSRYGYASDLLILRVIVCVLTSLSFTLLIGVPTIRSVIIYTLSGAFFGPLLVGVVERINTYQTPPTRAVVNER